MEGKQIELSLVCVVIDGEQDSEGIRGRTRKHVQCLDQACMLLNCSVFLPRCSSRISRCAWCSIAADTRRIFIDWQARNRSE